MSMAVGGKKGGPMADINVTPMADIMIVLLIIFMVITPMLQKGVDVRLPQAGNTKERKDEPKSIVVAIRKDSTTYLGSAKLANQRTAGRVDVAAMRIAKTGCKCIERRGVFAVAGIEERPREMFARRPA